jgi:pimeloyl-ACP methyl ester carboxylesterase
MTKIRILSAILLLLGLWLAWTPDQPTEVLMQQYAQPGAQRLSVQGQAIYLQDTGSRQAESVVLLHGFGASLQTWDAWAGVLQREYRVVRLDIPGFGLSGPATDNDYSEDADLRRLLSVLDHLGLQRSIVVGHSMGGRLAWQLAARHPERVSQLVLLAPDGFADPTTASENTFEVPPWLSLIRWSLPQWALKLGLAPAYADATRLTPAQLTRYQDMLRAPGVRAAVIERMRQSRHSDPVPRLRAITAPTLLLWGDKDAMIPPANAADYLSALPNARSVLLGGLGHIPHEEDPLASLAPVLAFIKSAP